MNCLSGKTVGTCDSEGCPLHGFCHCGCGTASKVALKNETAHRRTRGMPAMYRQGHHPETQASGARTRCSYEAGSRARSARDIPIERLRPLLDWLLERYGSRRRVGAALDISHNTVRNWYAATRGVSPEHAERIVGHVMACRPAARTTPWERSEARRMTVGRERRVDDRGRDNQRCSRARRKETAA